MPNIQTTIATLAHGFAIDLIAALRAHSLEQILGSSSKTAAKRAPAAKPSARPAVKTAATKGATSVDAMVAILRNHRNGLRSGELRSQLGVPESTFNYYVNKALSAKRIIRKGQRRGTTYFAR